MRRLPLALAILSAGCVSGPGQEEEVVESAQSAIIGGYALDPQGSGMVILSGGCSGTLITNRWVLTARHCFTTGGVVSNGVFGNDTPTVGIENSAAASVVITMGTESTTARTIVLHPDHDLALVELSRPFVMNGLTYGHLTPIYAAPMQSLVNQSVLCAGYGSNTYASGAGVLRRAWPRVNALIGTTIEIAPDANGKIMFKGDSGGGCYVERGTRRELIGVASWGHSDPNTQTVSAGYLINAALIRQWVTETLSNKQLVMQHGSNGCLAVEGRSTAAGARVEQGSCGLGSVWRFELASSGSYRLRAEHSKLCLTRASNGMLEQRPCDNGVDERFHLSKRDAAFEVRSAVDNYCIDVPFSSLEAGTDVQTYPCNNGSNQRLAIEANLFRGAFELRSSSTGRCADVPGLSTTPGVALNHYDCNGGDNQKFRFDAGFDDTFAIHPLHSELCLDIPFGNAVSGARINQYSCNLNSASNSNQRFRLEYIGHGTYRLRPKGSNACVEVPAGSGAGTPLELRTCSAGANVNQEWTARF